MADERWTGDWKAIEAWVTGLFPNLLHQLDDEGEDESAADWPYQILVYVGSRNGTSGSPVAQIDVSDLEADDAATHVAQGVEEVLEGLPDDRTAAVIKLTAVKQDDDGNEVPWMDVGNLTRSFTRPVATRAVLGAPTNSMREVWESPRPSAPMEPAMPAVPPRSLNGASLPMPGHTGGVPGVPAHGPVGQTPFTVSQGTPTVGEQAMIHAFSHMAAMLNMSFHEHRFLIEQNSALTDRLLSVHETAIRTSSTETRAARQNLEALNRDVLTLHRENIEANAATERVRLEAVNRAESRERQRVADENKQLRDTLEQTLAALQNQEEAGGDPNADPLRRKVVVAADQVLTQVLNAMSGQQDGNGARGAGAGGAGADSGQGQQGQGQQGQGQQTPRRPTPRRPGLPKSGQANGQPAAQGQHQGQSFDLNNVSPQQAAMVLRLLDPKVRKETMRQLAMMDPTLLDQLRGEADDALESEG